MLEIVVFCHGIYRPSAYAQDESVDEAGGSSDEEEGSPTKAGFVKQVL